jgi:cryptochrome
MGNVLILLYKLNCILTTRCSALSAAIEGGSDVFPVFVLDPHYIHSGRVGSARMTFLFETLSDLHKNLQQRSSSLFCLQGTPEHVLPQLFKQWDITRLAYEHDIEPYAKQRDQRVAEIAAKHGVEVVVRCASLNPVARIPMPNCALRRYGHTLFAPEELLEACSGKMPGSYGSLVKAAERLVVSPEIAAPAVIKTPTKSWLADVHAVPSMESIGLARQSTPFPGGETEGLSRLQRWFGSR